MQLIKKELEKNLIFSLNNLYQKELGLLKNVIFILKFLA